MQNAVYCGGRSPAASNAKTGRLLASRDALESWDDQGLPSAEAIRARREAHARESRGRERRERRERRRKEELCEGGDDEEC